MDGHQPLLWPIVGQLKSNAEPKAYDEELEKHEVYITINNSEESRARPAVLYNWQQPAAILDTILVPQTAILVTNLVPHFGTIFGHHHRALAVPIEEIMVIEPVQLCQTLHD